MSDGLQRARLALARGELQQAADTALGFARANPQDARPWAFLAEVFQRAGRPEGAVSALEQAAARQPTVPRVGALATALSRVGRVEDARSQLVALTDRRPRDPAAWRARVALEGSHGTAVERRRALQGLVAADPSHARDWLDLGQACAEVQAGPAAHEAVCRALACAPGSPVVLRRAAEIWLNNGYAAEAASALAELPSQDDALRCLRGRLAERQGHTARAVELLAPRVRSGQASVAEVQAWSRAMLSEGRAEEVVRVLEDSVPHAVLGHLLGRAHHALGDHAAAFAAHRAANEAMPGRWSQARLDAELDAIVALSDRPRPPTLPGGAGLVLVCGLPRSGTSLTEQLLAGHAQIQGAGELPTLRDLLAGLSNDPTVHWTQQLHQLDAATRARLGAQYLQAVRSAAGGGSIVVDKAPLNVLYVDALARLLPDARVVLCRRRPLDQCWSSYALPLGDYYAFTRDLGHLGHTTRRVLAFRDRLLSQPPLAVYDLQYERLTHDPEGEARRLLEFVGVDWQPAVLDTHTLRRDVRTASYAQVKVPIHSGRIGRSEAYRPWLGPLIEALGDELASEG